MTRADRRLLLVLAGVVGIALLGLLGWALARLTTPEALRAQTEPPSPTALFAPVEAMVLEQAVVGSGIVVPGRAYEPAVAPDGDLSVMTARPLGVGDRARFGTAIVEVSGRPVILLHGKLPAYRDLQPGDQGPDVRQLQEALADLDLYSGARSGRYGPATSAAVGRLYTALGRAPIEVGQESLAAARAAVRSAVRTEQEAAAALGLTASAPPAERRAAARALGYAREDLAVARGELRAQQQASGPTLPAAEVLFVPTGPVTVLSLGGQLGEIASSVPIRVASGQPHVEVPLSESASRGVREGQPARVTLAGDADPRPATVTRITGTPQQEGADGASADPMMARLRLDDPPAATSIGSSADVVIVTASTDHTVLTVPASALRYSDASAVTVVTRPGNVVKVIVGMASAGRVEVRAEDLSPGDEVRVGDRAVGSQQ